MSEHAHHSPKQYLMVFLWLSILTVLEIAVVYLGLPKTALAWFLVITALIKAALVAMFFMHLKFEGRLIYFIVALPFIIAVIFVLGLFPDIVVGYWR